MIPDHSMKQTTKEMETKKWYFTFSLMLAFFLVQAQESPKEEDYFRIVRMSVPENVMLEVGGLALLPNGDLGISTRRGDVYIVENPTSPRPFYRKFASGLHE